ncbi:Hypothetical predicted protein [Cloeon dipterum]|uniref:Protein CIP2A n=1 Tax=Cloeon dipterum TaxID=197152 RepID=A0A8S1CGP6_9INSE|nr:Hypothetical predicted protein [Cloeon dipterum]
MNDESADVESCTVANNSDNSDGKEDCVISKALDIARGISAASENEEKIILLGNLRRLIDMAQCETTALDNLNYQGGHGLLESVKNPFLKGEPGLLVNFIDALGLLLESSLKSGVQDSLALLNVLLRVTSNDYGQRVVASNKRIMTWLFLKLNPEDPTMFNNRESEIMDIILSLLKRCSRVYRVQIYEGWLREVVDWMKTQLVQDTELKDRQSKIVLEILLNICSSNRGRLPLIEQSGLKQLLLQISKLMSNKTDDIQIFTARLQLLLTPYDLGIDDGTLVPLSIVRIIGILQQTMENQSQTALLVSCLEYLNDIVNFSPCMVQLHERNWLLLIEEFLSFSNEEKKTWYNNLAEPLLSLLLSLHCDEVKLSISESTSDVINNCAAEFCLIILSDVLGACDVHNAAINSIKSKIFLLLAKSLASAEVWSRVSSIREQNTVSKLLIKILETLISDRFYVEDFDLPYSVSAAKLLTRVASLDQTFSETLNDILKNSLLFDGTGSMSHDQVLACVVLATHLADSFPESWLSKSQEFFERDDVCKQIVNALRFASHDLVLDLNFAIAKLSTKKGNCRLRKYLRRADSGNSTIHSFQDSFQLGSTFSSNKSLRNTLDSASRKELIAEYEEKIQSLNFEREQCQKTINSMKDLVDFYMSKEKFMENERAKLGIRNLEQIAENENMMRELRVKGQKIKEMQHYDAKLKQLLDEVRVDLGSKTKALAELSEVKIRLEKTINELSEDLELHKKDLAVHEQKISKYRQLAQDNKLEMAELKEALAKQDETLKAFKESNKEMLAELEELRRFKENILNITSKSK